MWVIENKLFKCLWLVSLLSLITLSCTSQRNSTTEAETRLLRGKWIISEQTVTPLSITAFCKGIEKGSSLQFDQDTLKVFKKQSNIPCDVFLFRATGNTINVIKEDMIWLCTYDLSQTILQITSSTFFTSDDSALSETPNGPPNRQEEITVTLTKQNL